MKNITTNRISLFSLLFFLSLKLAQAQDLPYKFTEDIQSKKNSSENTFALQLAATDFSFQGSYSKALKT